MQSILDALNNELLEGKQVGTLYHFTSFSNLENILKSNELKSGSFSYISFTRDKNMFKRPVHHVVTSCALVVDGDKISNKYKLTQYDHRNDGYSGDYEAEERVIADKISNIKSYIEKLIIITSELKAYNGAQLYNLYAEYVDTKAGYYDYKKETDERMLKSVSIISKKIVEHFKSFGFNVEER